MIEKATTPSPRLAAAALAAGLAASCAGWRPASVPMRTVFSAGSGSHQSLVVFLPGRGDGPEDFFSRGFISALHEVRPDADALAVDAHMGYFRAGTMVERLHEDVVQPARRRGYRQLWLVGVSAGGTAAILDDARHPGEVTGLVLLAPFLGDRETVAAVAGAGGVGAWIPASPPGEDFQVDIWRWVKGLDERGGERPVVVVLYGSQDRLADGHRLLAGALPPGRVLTVAGGHDWRTWRDLWSGFLRSPALAGPPAPAR